MKQLIENERLLARDRTLIAALLKIIPGVVATLRSLARRHVGHP